MVQFCDEQFSDDGGDGYESALVTVGFKEPSLELIEAGVKTFEARLASDPVTMNLRVGDRFTGHSGQRDVVGIEVVSVDVLPSFGAAWQRFGASLVPAKWGTPASATEAQAMYQKFYRRPLTHTDRVRIFGVRVRRGHE